MNSLPTVQLAVQPGVIDLAWGQPDPALLPVADMRRAAEIALEQYGADTLAYGADAGAGPLLDYLRARIERNEGRALDAAQIMLTGGNSDALDQIATHFSTPGDAVLVEAPTYHLAVRILRDHQLEIVPVATDRDGIRLDALHATLARLKSAGKQIKFLYTIPTFHNPTGVSLNMARRRELVKIAAQAELLLVEDDVYRELAYDATALPALWTLAEDGVVLRMGSFAKSLAPGVRLGWLTGKGEHIQRMAGSGLRDSGGGVNHFTAMLIAALCERGMYDAQLHRLREAYRERRDAMCDALATEIPELEFVKPGGGFFVWASFRNGVDTQVLRGRAPSHGVDFIHGARFFVERGGTNALRVAFSLYPPKELEQAMKRLREAIDAGKRG